MTINDPCKRDVDKGWSALHVPKGVYARRAGLKPFVDLDEAPVLVSRLTN